MRDERGRARDGRGKGGRRKFPDASRVPFSRTVFEVERRGVARVLTECARVTRVKWESGGDGERFSVPSRDAAKVVAICASLCYNYKIIKEKGVVLAFLRASVRAGVVLGLAAVVAAFVTSSMRSSVQTWILMTAPHSGHVVTTGLSAAWTSMASCVILGLRVIAPVERSAAVPSDAPPYRRVGEVAH